MSILASHLNVRPVRAFSDNYVWLIESPAAPTQVVAVDPGEAQPVITELKRRNLKLAAILLTHHHPDHIGGVPELLRLGKVPVIGPDDARIASKTRTVRDGEHCELPELGLGFEILQVPGHTVSHIAFWGHRALFCGDTLFSAGCGRMFEGNPEQMNASLNRLRDLPPETQVFCGHEYTCSP
jgi:hydroxyacylglutathione hydrolase